MQTAARKGGRPVAIYRPARGLPVVGLSRLADGRWRASGPERWTFSEPDEALAIARFREWEARKAGTNRPAILATSRPGDFDSLADAVAHVSPPQPPAEVHQMDTPTATTGEPVRVTRNADGSYDFYRDTVTEAAFWATVRREIIRDPKAAAQKLGLVISFDVPAPSPKLADLIEVYAAKPGVTSEEVSRCRRYWDEFVAAVGVDTVRDLDHDAVGRYETTIGALDLSPKSIKHRYTRVRTVINYARKRGKGIDDCRRALDVLAMLDVPEADPLDPKPIAPAEFWGIYRAAKKAGDDTFIALMLFAINTASYASEVGAVRWDDLDLKRGEYVARRNKTKVPRVATLWPQTVAALKKLPQDRPTVFNTSRQAYTRMSIFVKWDAYRTTAKGSATFGMIRDASFTLACRQSADQGRLLAGHRLAGAADNYVLRQPQAVREACDLIAKEFAVAKNA